MEFNQYIKGDNNQETKNTLFALLYQNENDTTTGDLTGSYFYVVVNNDTQFKINAYSLKKLINIIAPGALDDKENVADMDIATLIPSIVSMFITSGEKSGNDYTFHIDIQEAWKNLSELLSGFLNNPSSLNDLLQIDIAQYLGYADQAVAAIFAGLTYNEIGADGSVTGTKPVDSLKALMVYVDQNIPKCEADLRFKFDDSQYFTGATVEVNYADAGKNELTNSFVLDIPVIAVAGDDFIDVTEDFAITAEKRKAMEAINILKFQLNGKVIFSDPTTSDVKKEWGGDTLEYIWSINADLNPFVLFSERGFLIENLEKMGYFDFSIDMPAQGIYEAKNILSLHSDLSTGLLYVNFMLPGLDSGFIGSMGIPSSLSGVFELQAVADYITDLITKLTGGNVETVSDVDNVADISIEDILSFISLDSNGLKISNVSTILNEVLDMIGLDAGIKLIASRLVLSILTNGGDSLAITVNDINDSVLPGVRYGVCDRKADTEIPAYAYEGFSTGFIVSGTPTNDIIQKTYEYGEDFNITFDQGSVNGSALDKLIYINGVGPDGTEQYGRGKYFSNNFNPYLIGKQTVRVTYGMYTGWDLAISGLEGLVPGIGDMLAPYNIPFGGIQTFEVEVEVLPPVDPETVKVVPTGTDVIGIGENVADVLQAYIMYEGRQVKVTSDMLSCAGVLDEKGIAMVSGDYTIKVEYLSITSYVDVRIGGIVYNNIDSIAMGEDVQKALNPMVQTYSNGRFYNKSISFDNATTNMNIFAEGSSIIKVDESLRGSTLEITYTYEIYYTEKQATISLKLNLPEGRGYLTTSDKLESMKDGATYKLSRYDSMSGLFNLELADGRTVTASYLDGGNLNSALAGRMMFMWTINGNPMTASDLMAKYGLPTVEIKLNGTITVTPDENGFLSDVGTYLVTVSSSVASKGITQVFSVVELSSTTDITSEFYQDSNILAKFGTQLKSSNDIYYLNGRYYVDGYDGVSVDIHFYTDYETEKQKEVLPLGMYNGMEAYLPVGEYTAVARYTRNGYTEEYTCTLKSNALVSINEEYSYVQPNILFDNAFIYNKDSKITFRYGEEGYGFYDADGILSVDAFGWRIEVRDKDGKLVDLVDGKLTQMGVYYISVYPAKEMGVVEFAPVTLTVTLEEPFLLQNEPSKFLSDDIGKNVSLLKDGEVISERIAYYGAEKGYRFVAADGSAIMEYAIELNLTNVQYGTATEQGAQAIYVAQSGDYMTVFNVTHVESEIKHTVLMHLNIKPLGEYGYDTPLNLTQRFDGMFVGINYGGASDASLIYNADEDSYGVIAEDGTFVPLTLELTYNNNIVELKNGKINNFTISTDDIVFIVKLLGSVEGIEHSVEQIKVTVRYLMSLTLGQLNFAGYVNGTVKITEEDGTVKNANIVYDNGYKLKDEEGNILSEYEVMIEVQFGLEVQNNEDVFVDGRLNRPSGTGATQYVYIRYVSDSVEIISIKMDKMIQADLAQINRRWNINNGVNGAFTTLYLENYTSADYTFKYVEGQGMGYYHKTTNEKIDGLTARLVYKENAADEEWIDISDRIGSDGKVIDPQKGSYAIELLYDKYGLQSTLMSLVKTM